MLKTYCCFVKIKAKFTFLHFLQAYEKYERGLLLIDKALSIPISCPSQPDLMWEKAAVMLEKMKKTK
jgi:hypothetical protein